MSDETAIPTSVEVERKWLLDTDYVLGLLDSGLLDGGSSSTVITQGYLIRSPGEFRVRRDGSSAYVTVKGDGAMARDEWNSTEAIPDWVIDYLFEQAEAKITKTRYRLEGLPGGRVLELDVFGGWHTGLCLVEAEWTGPKDQEQALLAEAQAYELPDIIRRGLVREVTFDPVYKNKNLAANGVPAP